MLWWNQKELPQPPTNTYKSTRQDLDLTKFKNVLYDGIKHFKDNEFLTNEAAILARILYRMKTKFRTAKDFKYLEKLERSLGIYLKANMCRYLSHLADMIPSRYEKNTYLPTKNMLNYILVRLQGLAKLMERSYDTSLLAASELNQRFYIGHFWKQFLIIFALVSRISILIKYNAKFICDLYGKLLPHSYKLGNSGREWLPEGYILPVDLRTWLGVQWVYEEDFVDLTFEPTNDIVSFFNLADDDDDDIQFCDEYILLDDEDKQIERDFRKLPPVKEAFRTFSSNRMRGFSINEDDIGEDIAEIVELNDTTLNDENDEDINIQAKKNNVNPTSNLEVIEKEICLPTESHQHLTNEVINKDNILDKDGVISIKEIDFQNNEEKAKSCLEDIGEEICFIRSDESADENRMNRINEEENVVISDEDIISVSRTSNFSNSSLIVLDDTINTVNKKCVTQTKKNQKNIGKGVIGNVNSVTSISTESSILLDKDPGKLTTRGSSTSKKKKFKNKLLDENCKIVALKRKLSFGSANKKKKQTEEINQLGLSDNGNNNSSKKKHIKNKQRLMEKNLTFNEASQKENIKGHKKIKKKTSVGMEPLSLESCSNLNVASTPRPEQNTYLSKKIRTVKKSNKKKVKKTTLLDDNAGALTNVKSNTTKKKIKNIVLNDDNKTILMKRKLSFGETSPNKKQKQNKDAGKDSISEKKHGRKANNGKPADVGPLSLHSPGNLYVATNFLPVDQNSLHFPDIIRTTNKLNKKKSRKSISNDNSNINKSIKTKKQKKFQQKEENVSKTAKKKKQKMAERNSITPVHQTRSTPGKETKRKKKNVKKYLN